MRGRGPLSRAFLLLLIIFADLGQQVLPRTGVSRWGQGHAFQGTLRLPHPIAHGQFAMIPLRDDVRQPDRRDPPQLRPT
jgi:hypothetical protein